MTRTFALGSLCGLLAVPMLATPAWAVTRTFVPGSGTVGTAANWNPAAVPGVADDVVLAGSVTLTNDVAGWSVHSITLPGGPSSQSSLTGSPISLSGGLTVNDGLVLVDAGLVLTAPQTFTLTGKHVDFTESLDLGANALTLIAGGGAGNDVVIQCPVTGAGGSLVKAGSSMLAILSGPLTYTGSTVVHAGTVFNQGGIGGTAVTIDGDGQVNCSENEVIPNAAAVTLAENGKLSVKAETIGSLAGTGGSLVLGFATLTVGDSTTTSFHGTISGDGAVTKVGSGTLTLSGANTYAGLTTVTAGRLAIDGAQATNAVSVTGGTLAGNGTVGNVTVTSGVVSPGTSGVGKLTTGALSLAPASVVTVHASGVAANAHGEIDVVGTANVAGTLTLTLGYVPTVGDTLTVLANDGIDPIVGTFKGLAEGATLTVPGATFAVSYVGGDGNDVVLTCTSVAPVEVDAGAAVDAGATGEPDASAPGDAGGVSSPATVDGGSSGGAGASSSGCSVGPSGAGSAGLLLLGALVPLLRRRRQRAHD